MAERALERNTDSFSGGFVSDDEAARDWRDGVARELSRRATATATALLAGLLETNPADHLLETALREAEVREWDESWQGPTLSDLIALIPRVPTAAAPARARRDGRTGSAPPNGVWSAGSL
jgi:hypothetical protein